MTFGPLATVCMVGGDAIYMEVMRVSSVERDMEALHPHPHVTVPDYHTCTLQSSFLQES